MTTVKALAAELKLHVVSLASHCRTHGITTGSGRRLPAGARGGQMLAHVKDTDARAIRKHYADRLMRD